MAESQSEVAEAVIGRCSGAISDMMIGLPPTLKSLEIRIAAAQTIDGDVLMQTRCLEERVIDLSAILTLFSPAVLFLLPTRGLAFGLGGGLCCGVAAAGSYYGVRGDFGDGQACAPARPQVDGPQRQYWCGVVAWY
jgi:hypothetical protein